MAGINKAEKKIISNPDETDQMNDEDLFSSENEAVTIYDESIVEKKRYKESKLNRIYKRKKDNKVYINYENRRSRYSEGRNW